MSVVKRKPDRNSFNCRRDRSGTLSQSSAATRNGVIVHDKQMNQLRCPSARVLPAKRCVQAAQRLGTCSSSPCAQTCPQEHAAPKPHAFTLQPCGGAWEAAARRCYCTLMCARAHCLTASASAPFTSTPRPWEGALEGAAALEVRGAHSLAHVLLQLGLHLAPLDGLGRRRARALLIRLHCGRCKSSHTCDGPCANACWCIICIAQAASCISLPGACGRPRRYVCNMEIVAMTP